MHDVEFYKSIPLQSIEIENISIGLRQIGKGENLVFVHGFPTHGYTWRKLIPKLSENYKCHILDLPGLGDSTWTKDTDFKSEAQARYITKLLKQLGINKYNLIAHDSGATVARVIAINHSDKVENLILFNTEIPNHRPPWIPFYQKVGLLPFVPAVVRMLFKQNWFIKSPMGLKELYSDKSMLNEAINISPYLDAAIHSHQKTVGVFKYLKGIDWKVIDDFKKSHSKIKANVLFLWGEDDKTFPIELGKEMLSQFNCKTKFVTVKNASLLPHEEQPEEIINEIQQFLKNFN